MSDGLLSDRQNELLADDENRKILSIIDDTDGSLDLTALAAKLVRHEAAIIPDAEFDDLLERTYIELHHNRLPKLDEAGLLAYDAERNTVESVRNEDGTIVEFTGEVSEAVASLFAASDRTEVGVIEGRDAIIEYGRRLADEAEDELFCMYTNTDLLEEECVRRAAQAIDRGARMYLGSHNREVRELTRQELPEATIWEPQLDLLNTPEYPRVGRLVLTDRCQGMLGILREPPSEDTYPEEQAIVGSGEGNPLVVLIRELLGPRLDHLDYQSTDFRNELPMER